MLYVKVLKGDWRSAAMLSSCAPSSRHKGLKV